MNPDNVQLIMGKVEDTLLKKENLPESISVLRLDTDWYESTKIELQVLYPRLVKGGILIVDDYGLWNGSRRAVDEYFKIAKDIDPEYKNTLDLALKNGVKLLCYDCKFSNKGIKINSGGVTTFSNYTVVSENRCVKLPEGIPFDVASLLGCAVPTGAGIVMNSIRPSHKNSIAIFGAGGIGLSAIMAAKMFACGIIIVVDIEDSKLEKAQEFGATHLINSKNDNAVGKIHQITQDKGVDYSIEAAGRVKVIVAGTVGAQDTVEALEVTAGGSGYTGATGVATTTTGDGSGLTVDTTVSAGAVTAVAINAVGTGYKINDVITVSGGGGNATLKVLSVESLPPTASDGVEFVGAQAGAILPVLVDYVVVPSTGAATDLIVGR